MTGRGEGRVGRVCESESKGRGECECEEGRLRMKRMREAFGGGEC